MNPQIQRTIELIKKSYDQPILFHILHNHLTFLLQKSFSAHEITDEWSKILVFSAYSNKIPNQGLEMKIQSFIKKLRPPFDSNEKKIKLMIICYYLLNRPILMINHIIVFELVTNFMGYSDYIDGLIIKVFSNLVTSRIYSVPANKKVSDDSINRMVESIRSCNLSDVNKIKALVCFIPVNIAPFDLSNVVIDQNYAGYKYLEIFCLYAKYATNTSFIKDILPNNISFIEGLTAFMNNQFMISTADCNNMTMCVLEDRSIYDVLKKSFELSTDKEKFISDVIEYVMSLK